MDDHSEVMRKGLERLNTDNETLSPVLRAVLLWPLPSTVQHVVMAKLASAPGKTLFNLVRHALGVVDWLNAERIELQRLQLDYQWLVAVEGHGPWLRALESHGVAALLFPEFTSTILRVVNT